MVMDNPRSIRQSHSLLPKQSSLENGHARYSRGEERVRGTPQRLEALPVKKTRSGSRSAEPELMGYHKQDNRILNGGSSWMDAMEEEDEPFDEYRVGDEGGEGQGDGWDRHMSEVLENETLSSSWRTMLNEKQEALRHALLDVQRTKNSAALLIREKASVAAQLEEEFRSHVVQARSELRLHMERSRAVAKRRRKRELAVRRDLTDAQTFANVQDKAFQRQQQRLSSRQSSFEAPSQPQPRTRQKSGETAVMQESIDKAQMRLFMQQKRLKSARLEMIECLREQQKIQNEIRNIREQQTRQRSQSFDGERERAALEYQKPRTPQGKLPAPVKGRSESKTERLVVTDVAERGTRVREGEGGAEEEGEANTTMGSVTPISTRGSDSPKFDASKEEQEKEREREEKEREREARRKEKEARKERDRRDSQGTASSSAASHPSPVGLTGARVTNGKGEPRGPLKRMDTRSTAYHPDLGFVGKGVPTTEAEAKEFAKNVNDPTAHLRAVEAGDQEAIKASAAADESIAEEDDAAAEEEDGGGSVIAVMEEEGDQTTVIEEEEKLNEDGNKPQQPPAQPSLSEEARAKELLKDVRKSGFIVPAFVDPELKAHRQRALIGRSQRSPRALVPQARDYLNSTGYGTSSLTIDYGTDVLSDEEQDTEGNKETTEAAQTDGKAPPGRVFVAASRYVGLGMAGKKSRVLGINVKAGLIGEKKIDSSTGMSTRARVVDKIEDARLANRLLPAVIAEDDAEKSSDGEGKPRVWLVHSAEEEGSK